MYLLHILNPLNLPDQDVQKAPRHLADKKKVLPLQSNNAMVP